MTARDLLLLICFGSFALMVVALLLSAATSRRKKVVELDHRRLDLLERALQHPSLDEATRTELLQLLANRGRPHEPQTRHTTKLGDWWHLIWYGPAWILFVVGGCMLAAHTLSLTPGLDVRTFLPMTITGFAMLTLPMALRELRVRGQRPSPADR